MDPNFTGAPSDTAEFESESLLDISSLDIADCFDDLLKFDLESFDFNMLESLPPPPSAAVVGVDSVSSEHSVGPTAGVDRGKSVVSEEMGGGGGKKAERRRRNKIPVGASSRASFKGETVSLVKKALAPEQLAELAIVDPKRVKRILANRQSAAKSKERKMRHMRELQKKQESAETAVRLRELTITRDAMQQELQIRKALSEAIEEEVQSLRKEDDHLDVILRARSLTELLSSQMPPQQFHYSPYDQQIQLPMPEANPFLPSSQGSSESYDPNFSDFNPPN
ncbi:bZIP transcription factor 18 isoform X2 [Cajanus cajan]|uniref:bZIP transcription factor 18 isoform X2 n=1 Tax=Cajanus cajan TaxID=3821 RepID=UPI00098D9593|nr:bZIP transcription factor 18 isoform X2 [Cajanus cajan]